MANILSTANSALIAAQAGLATTGHNIANARTPGYNRQIVVQAAIAGQNEGGGFIGKGATILTVKRQYSEYLGDQLRAINTSKGQIETHYTEASRINSMLADPSSGLAPVLQDFFKGVQDLAGNSSANPSRQGMLASAESLAARFQTLDGQFREMREAVNIQVTTAVASINSYADQIANLNAAIGKAQSAADGHVPNDMLDQRDYLVSELGKLTQVTVVKENLNYSVFVGNGQPMVIGTTASKLAVIPSHTDKSELQVGYVAGSGKVVPLAESGLPGGALGGLFEFRATTLSSAQNSLGRIALGLANRFNAQHELGMDQTGAPGGQFFTEALPVVNGSIYNKGIPLGTPADVRPTIDNVSALTTSDYRFGRDAGGNYTITRLADNAQLYSNPLLPTTPYDGINFNVNAGTMANGDVYVIKPTFNGAGSFSVLVKDQAKIAAAAPIVTAFNSSNSGAGVISAGSVDSNFKTPPGSVPMPVQLNYVAAVPATNPPTGTLNDSTTTPASTTGFPFAVTVTAGNNAPVSYAAGTAIPYTDGATISFGGVNIQITGQPADLDSFTVKTNPNAGSDNRNMLLLGALQTANTLGGATNAPQGVGSASFQGAFGQLVSKIGNKTHELEVTKSAETKLFNQVNQAQQAESGVNLDEEAANLIRYQQNYQAAAKVMQVVKEVFDTLVSLR
jgi:flagellar hook-associated protein 1 FlgK